MYRLSTVLSVAFAAAAVLALPAQAADSDASAGTRIKAFKSQYQGYAGAGTGCNKQYAIRGYEPRDGKKHPVFIYTVGFLEIYDNGPAMAAVKAMAERGYVAATVNYITATFGTCDQIGAKAQCIYDAGSTESAVNAVCSRASADCSRGVLAGGFSQGSIIATQAHNYDTRVAAAWGMGTGVQYGVASVKSCMTAGGYSLPTDHLRIADGVADMFLAPVAGGVESQVRAVTGLTSCADGSVSCYRPNGSGYHVIQAAEIPDGLPGHCYMRASPLGCFGGQRGVNQTWLTGDADWSLSTELDWLSGFAPP